MGISTVVCGRSGRMATVLAQAVSESTDLELTCRLNLRGETGESTVDGEVHNLREVLGPPPVVVDFTRPEATVRLLRQAEQVECALVIGTSGLDGADRELMRRVAGERPVVFAPNFSLGLAAVRRFVSDLADRVGAQWDAGILDIHFAGKADAPSSTALALAAAWGGSRAGPDPTISSFRIGDAVSEHRVIASGRGEQVEVCHKVTDRAAFVPGVLAAIRFADRADPGLYQLEDVLCG